MDSMNDGAAPSSHEHRITRRRFLRGTAVGAQGYVVKGDFDQTKLLDMIRRLVRT